VDHLYFNIIGIFNESCLFLLIFVILLQPSDVNKATTGPNKVLPGGDAASKPNNKPKDGIDTPATVRTKSLKRNQKLTDAEIMQALSKSIRLFLVLICKRCSISIANLFDLSALGTIHQRRPTKN